MMTLSKRMYAELLQLPSRRVVHPAIDDDFVIREDSTGGYFPGG